MVQYIVVKIGTKQLPNLKFADQPVKKRKLSSKLTKAYF